MATPEDKKRLGQKIGEQAKTFMQDVTRPGANLGKATYQVGQDISKGLGQFVQDVKQGYTGNAPTAPGIPAATAPSPIQKKPGQRNQAAAGFAGAQTGDFSGTGMGTAPMPDKSPIRVISDSVRDQLSSNRGYQTQLTQLGATAVDGTKLPSRGGTFSTVDGNGDGTATGGGSGVFAQLAAMNALKEPSTGNQVSVIPNSYANERNARLRDPNNKLMENLDRAVRNGTIAPKNAYRIAQDAITASQNQALGNMKVTEDARQANMSFDQKDRAMTAEQEMNAAKLRSAENIAGLDRQTKQNIALGEAGIDQQKLALDQYKALTGNANAQSRLGFDQAKFAQQFQLDAAKMYQQGDIEGAKQRMALGNLIQKVLAGETQGMDPKTMEVQLRALGVNNMADVLYPQE